ncbi:CTD small phosphatase-like protein, partial [Plectropomus leopardus]|uniref:CTD small phosphatase-like protein n=1 Tax=Plectropomus leopardus TaxID=160734 RepID=UPI001C4A8256
MQITKCKCFSAPACFHFCDRTSICISTCSPSALPLPPVVLTASQSNSSLKKQRSRSIFSTFFCCFRNYNVDPPATNTNTSSLPPPVEENGSPPKCDQVEVIPVPSV